MATIRDVARASGVSVATVSYVLNNGPRAVREETRAQVLEAVEQLSYHPNAMARALVSGRVNTVGILFGRVEPAIVTNTYVTGVLEGIVAECALRNFNVTLFTQRWKDAATSSMPLKDGRCDGVLLVAPTTDTDIIDGLAQLRLPVVVVSAAVSEGTGLCFVDVDNEAGARLGTEHLIALGHRRVAHLTGEFSQPSALERRSGFLHAMSAAGIEVPEEFVVECGYGIGRGSSPTRRILTSDNMPTALFCGNDSLAIDALKVAKDLNLSVPHDVSIVGFDDVPMSTLVTPALTTVRQPLASIGSWAVQLLVQQIEGNPPADWSHRATPELIVRGSTGPPG